MWRGGKREERRDQNMLLKPAKEAHCHPGTQRGSMCHLCGHHKGTQPLHGDGTDEPPLGGTAAGGASADGAAQGVFGCGGGGSIYNATSQKYTCFSLIKIKCCSCVQGENVRSPFEHRRAASLGTSIFPQCRYIRQGLLDCLHFFS